jgi:hypothetical protein
MLKRLFGKCVEDVHIFPNAVVYDHDKQTENIEQVVLERNIFLLS